MLPTDDIASAFCSLWGLLVWDIWLFEFIEMTGFVLVFLYQKIRLVLLAHHLLQTFENEAAVIYSL